MTRIFLTTLFLAFPLAAQKPEAETMMQAATKKEVVDGDLNGAIKQYSAIVARYAKTDRAVTAKALVRMAECYQKMGDAESRKIYEQVVREYADQKDAVAEARAHLGGGGRPARQSNTLVWSGPKVDAEGTVTPDGRYISSVDWDSGDLMVHDLATGDDRYLTHTGQDKKNLNHYAEESAISRDGKLVAYSWWDKKDDHYHLRLANATGEPNPRVLYNSPDVKWLMPYDWAPDGKSVAVEVQRTDHTVQIGLVAIPDGSFRALKSLSFRGAGRMFFSPDGRWLGYDATEGTASPDHDVFVIAVDGSREIHAVEHRGNDNMAGWSPDGKWLLFSSNRTGSMDLWAAPFSDGKVDGPPQLLKSAFGDRTFPMGVALNGTLHYGVDKGGAGPSSIQVASFDAATGKTSGAIELTHGSLDSSPAWSPDSKELAYVSQRGQLGGASIARVSVLVIRSMETGASRELLPEMSTFFGLSWSPDKRSFLAHGRDAQGQSGIFRIDAQTGAVSTVIQYPDKELYLTPVWGPDGKRFYYIRQPRGSNPAYYAFMERGLATGAEREIIRRPRLGGLRLSPDGQYIATPSTDPATNSRTLLLIPVAGGEPRVLMSIPSGATPEDLSNFWQKGESLGIVEWEQESRSLLMVKGNLDHNETFRIPIDGGEPSKLGFPAPFRGALSRDGKHVALFTADPATPHSTEIWALENFLPPKPPAK